ncbi:MAG: hypothetical protein NTV23_04135 [Propionibacteriales bacterium]|nr:hypothetical protein [Propionibacteriales bacterium]
MIKRAVAVASFAAGYVLGAKAGEERYEQIRTYFLRVKTNPDVREKVHEAVEFAHDQGSALADKAVQAVRSETEVDADLRPHGATIDLPTG